MPESAAQSVLAVDCRPGFRLKVGDNLLSFREGCTSVLNDLLETEPSEFGRKDFAVLNLLCAPALRGSEGLDIPNCLARLNRLTEFVKSATDRNLYRFPTDPDYGHSEPMWRMALLVTLVKRDFGAAYNPVIVRDKESGIVSPLTDSRDVFIHGLLADDAKRRWGTCASIPVLITAVARRLGYPVALAVAGRHVYARWEGSGACFNIEASNPMGMTVPSEQELRQKVNGLPLPEAQDSRYYLRTLFPCEEFALFMTLRVESLISTAKYEETLLWSARALQFSPEDPQLPHTAHFALDLAMKHRLRRIHPERRIPPPSDPNPFLFNVGDLLRSQERSSFLAIVAHYKEAKGELHEARRLYEDACRQNFYGNNEQRDLQRFVRKHGSRRRKGPLLPPKNLGRKRSIELHCKPHEEAKVLRRLADRFERGGRLVQAHGALRDLYLFDPADAEVFQRARAIAQHPQYREQMNARRAANDRVPGRTP